MKHLRAGDTVAVIAPAGPCKEAERVAQIEAMFARHGLRARLYPSCSATHPQHDYLSGSDEQRLADLHAALSDEHIAAIFGLRGGYGCARFIDRIDAELVRAHPKSLIGYSDLTTLHALWSRQGVPSFHAPMPASDWLEEGAQADTEALFGVLMQPLLAGTVLAPALAADTWHQAGVAEGSLVGGNLAIVASLIGTPYAVPVQDNLLLLEDIGEAPYRIDRLLTQLRLAGALDAATGFVLGSFSGDEDPMAVVQDHLLRTAKPVLAGWPAGHGQPNRALPLGVRMQLDAAAGTLQLMEAALSAPSP